MAGREGGEVFRNTEAGGADFRFLVVLGVRILELPKGMRGLRLER